MSCYVNALTHVHVNIEFSTFYNFFKFKNCRVILGISKYCHIFSPNH